MQDKSVWFYSSINPSQGIVLLLHGLNTKPSKMDELAHILTGKNLDVYRVALYEADQLGTSVDHIKEQWYEETKKSFLIASQRAEELDKPLYLVGFSLGALLGLKILLREHNAQFDKMILLAPAIAPRKYVEVIGNILTYFTNPTTSLKSIAPSEYVISDSIPLAAYLATAEFMKELWIHASDNLNKPCLVLLDPKDELISYTRLQEFKEQFKLHNWQIKEIKNNAANYRNKYHHLIIDEKSLGKNQWLDMKNIIDAFLKL